MRLSFLLSLTFLLGACQTAERTTNTVGEGAEDAAEAVGTVARGAADAVEDAAGAIYGTAADVFDSDDRVTDVALVRPTAAPGARVSGTVQFHEMDDALMVMVSLSGLTPGRHGIHIHQTPACGSADADDDGMMEPGGAAGSHWDPLNTMNHGAATDALDAKHLGDLGNITAEADGTAEASFTIADFPSRYDVARHAIIVHAEADNTETDPGGSSGARVGCGVIEGRM